MSEAGSDSKPQGPDSPAAPADPDQHEPRAHVAERVGGFWDKPNALKYFGVALPIVIMTTSIALQIAKFNPENLKFDFTALLGLVLAVFSIFLSAMFYVKANESSNQFYQKTDQITGEITRRVSFIQGNLVEGIKNLQHYLTDTAADIERLRSELRQEKAIKRVELQEEAETIFKQRESVLEQAIEEIPDERKRAEMKSLLSENPKEAITMLMKLPEVESERDDLRIAMEQNDKRLDSVLRKLEALNNAPSGPPDISPEPVMRSGRYLALVDMVRQIIYFETGLPREAIMTAPPDVLMSWTAAALKRAPDATKKTAKEIGIIDAEGNVTANGFRALEADLRR